MDKKSYDYLIIEPNKSILYRVGEDPVVYEEGKLNEEAKIRYQTIRKKLEDGYLEKVIQDCSQPELEIHSLSEDQMNLIDNLVNSITSEVGRAIVGLTVLQLTLKSIEPNQSIRLHKGSSSSIHFSWKEGIPMRVLDKNFITPVLRRYGLLKLNADGFMMTRSLAENYPYSGLYKAAIRGAKTEWVEITNSVEDGTINATDALKHIVSLLLNKSDEFQKLSDDTLKLMKSYLESGADYESILKLVEYFVETSEYSARIFEVSIHSFFQALDELKLLGGYLKPLSQMRSANKKHGNIGDIEITAEKNSMSILESWDAKYGKSYMRDELEELCDKLAFHEETELAGFVTNQAPDLRAEITKRIEEIEAIYDVTIKIFSFKDWVGHQIERFDLDGNKLGHAWLRCFTESLCQKRREIAPIDEPTFEWVASLKKIIESELN